MDAAVQDPLVGRTLDGRYRVLARIAKGGMATVYQAMDTRLDRTVAVKVMHEGLAADEEAVARFIREAKASARLSHPDVVSVFDQGADGGSVFLVMEHVEGRTLRSLLRERGHLTPREALDVLQPVLAALGAAHRAGIVHRDVKPENVLLAWDGRVKVADFGLARAVASGASASTGALIGTVSYLAPELVERGIADARSDVYSAGVVLYELLTGAKPFTGDSPVHVAYRHVHDNVPAPSARRPGLAPELDALVAHATSRDPDERPDDASALLAEVVAARRALTPEALDHDSDPREDTVVMTRPVVPFTRADGVEPTAAVAGGAGGAVPGGDEATTTMPAVGADEPAPAGAPRRRRRSPLVVAVLVLALLAGGGWWFTAGPGARTPVPSLLGMSQEQATAKARTVGLAVRIDDPAFSETVPAGQVLSTDPEPGGSVADGGQVAVVLSRGPERIAVPDVVGRTGAEAEAAITSAGLSVGSTEQAYDDTVPAGSVISVTPGVGQPLRRDTALDLVVSRGREPVDVADWSDKPVDDARAALEAAGLKVTVTQRFSERVERDSVISQTPPAGRLLRGDTVRLLVSQGPPLVDVPRVVDLKVDEARRRLEAAGFVVRTRGTQILNRVFTQNPARGQAPKGSTVTLGTI